MSEEIRTTLKCKRVSEGDTIKSRTTGQVKPIKFGPQDKGNIPVKLATALKAKVAPRDR